MALPFYNWSKTAGSNATADSTINWAENQAPSSVNDSARAMMASTAAYRDDTSGSIGAAGTSSAYVVTTNQIFDTTAHLRFSEIKFVAPATNAAGVTLNVDGLGAAAINTTTGVAVPAGTLIAGSVYGVTYYSNTPEWVLHNFYANSFNIPLGGMMDYIAPSVPNANFVFPIGQAISRTTYAALFALIGTTYGVGDGSTTFNVPDLTGRVTAMKEASATRLTATYFGGNSTALGAVGGLESHALTTAQLASHSHANSLNDPGHFHNLSAGAGDFSGSGAIAPREGIAPDGRFTASTKVTGITITNAAAGSGNAHNNVQPTMIVNKILRII